MKKPTAAELMEFRKLDASAQLRQLRGSRIERAFKVERDGIDQAERTAWLSIASDQPYERWWGVEILDMAKKSIRTERLDAGFAILVGHDTSDQVGVAMKFEITAQKKLRVQARFSKSARGEEIFQDVLDGIRVNASVGYIIHDLILEKQEGDVATYRVTDWEPYEGSLVAVPADPSVGVGRSLEPPAPKPQSQGESMTPEQEAALREKIAKEERAKLEEEQRVKAAAQANTPEAILQRERTRVADITAAGVEYKDFGGVEIAAEEALKPSGTVESFKARILDVMRNKSKPTPTAEPGRTHFGDGARQILRHGVMRGFTKPVIFTDGSRMEPLEAAHRSGMWLLATVGANPKAARWCKDHGLGGHIEQRVATEDVGSAGGYLVPDEMEQSIIDLREAYGLARRLARRRPMAGDTKSIPKRSSGVTAYFVNEDNSGVTASDKGWANVNLVARTLAALSLISKNLEEDSIIDVVDDLVQEQAYAFATKEDQCWLIGDGTSTYGGMQGLKTLFEATAYASRFTAATNHDTMAEYDNSDLSGVMGALADFPGMNPSWIASKNFCENVFGRLQRTAGGNTGANLTVRARYGYGGYDADTTEIMPKDPAADQSNVVVSFFGDFSKSSSFGDRRGIMVQVLRERYAEKLQVGILSSERFHIVNHDVGTTAVKGPVAALMGQ